LATILVDDPLTQKDNLPSNKDEGDATVASWVIEKVNGWEQTRNERYVSRWNEYYRLWRGIWAASDKARKVERSRIIAPALQQAIESSVAEMEESVFHRKRWFDIDQDVIERQEEEANQELEGPDFQTIIDKLLEDFDEQGVPQAISEILLNGALYGTGIGKICVEQKEVRVPIENVTPTSSSVEIKSKPVVSLVSVDPREFVIDTAGSSIDTALGMAHIYRVPLHDVLRKQDKGVYRKGFVGLFDETQNTTEKAIVESNSKEAFEVEIVEYHGLVPKRLFDEATKTQDESVSNLVDMELTEDIKGTEDDSSELVEAIVWIANRSTLLKVVRNPFIMQDRSFISFQYDTVPNRFWGRGVSEKGYNPQKGLDAELRARIDSLALSTYPMLLINGMLAPRNQNYEVSPGRNIVVSGNIGEAIAPFKFPAPDPQSYKQTAEFERMVTVATGSLDSAAPLGVNPRNETASGISMMMSAVLKRSKRTMRNIEHQFLSPLVHKIAWRYMQFDTERYPVADYKFKVVGALGAQAREFEVAQLTQLLQTQPPDQPGYWIVLKGILRNYNVEDKEALIDLIDAFLEKSLNPQPPEPTIDEQVKLREAERKDRDLDFKIEKAVEDELRKDVEVEAEATRDRGEAIWNASEAVLNARKAEVEKIKAISALITSLASAAGVEGEQLETLVGEAQGLVREAVTEAQSEPELESLRTSMTRQQQEEVQPGIGEREPREVPTNGGQPTI
jgi:hypothetical protein